MRHFDRDSVKLEGVREKSVERILPADIATRAGDYPVDLVVVVTGFDAGTGPLLAPVHRR